MGVLGKSSGFNLWSKQYISHCIELEKDGKPIPLPQVTEAQRKEMEKKQQESKNDVFENLGHRFYPGIKWKSLPQEERDIWIQKAREEYERKTMEYLEDPKERWVL